MRALRLPFYPLVFLFCLVFHTANGQKKEPNKLYDESTVAGLSFRLLGPSLTSGRIIDMAIDAQNNDVWYIAAASGGVWKTSNHGISFEPIFDGYGSYSIGCVEIAASNNNTIWVGTGENNNQRSVAYGDGVYKSTDGGKSFTHMGLKESQHIGSIVIHPKDENTLWVAAYGPVWNAGGERGVYKSIDGGKTWERTLFVSDETGIAEICIDPTNPDILYASAHQRRRHEWTYIGGGPESAVYKSTDGGKTWVALNSGLPKNEMGRIGLSVSPADPNYVYAIVEARGDKGGVYLSTNKGASFNKMSGYNTSGNYYQEIICDPINRDKFFVMDTWLHHSTDGGRNVVGTGEDMKHVDNHCIWIDPKNTSHWLVGCDGGLYETYTHAREWRFYDNLPITQFYKVATDNASPFYHVYGGTQDNNSMGGPAATRNVDGIANSDWFITWGGDGFESAIDPLDPNIAYSQSQYGGLARINRKNGEKMYIQPLPAKGEAAYRWNWDAPLLVSPHDPKTLYFAANKLFKSTNRGDDWTTISPDLSRQLDRNKLKVMGQVWSIDAVMKNQSTTYYGNVIALDESPVTKGLLYAGTDDGLIQVSENDGKTWTKYETFAGIPAQTRVNMLTASMFEANTVYAAFVNQRSGDFKPYLLKSTDKGKTWISIAANLPARASVYCIKQDHIDPNLLFVGTEFGAYFTTDGGQAWTKLAGLPTIAIYDLDIQKRENDLVAASFGRGFYVLDNYSALRFLNKDNLNKKAHLFPIKDPLLYVPESSNGLAGTGNPGHNFWIAKNPAFGAVFTLHMKDAYKSKKSVRTETELKLEKEKKDVFYPSFEQLREEASEEEASLIWIIKNSAGEEVRKINSTPSKGISKVVWNLRMASSSPINPNKPKPGRYENADDGMFVVAGNYTVEVYLVYNSVKELLVPATNFVVKNIDENNNKQSDPQLLSFRKEVAELNRKVSGSASLMEEYREKIRLMKFAITNYAGTDLNMLQELRAIELGVDSCALLLYGDGLKSSKEFETEPSLLNRLGLLQWQLSETSSEPTNTQKQHAAWVSEEYIIFRNRLNALISRARAAEAALDEKGIPYLKGKNESWKKH